MATESFTHSMAHKGCRMPSLVINIPGPVMPLERGERFEDPLWDAFEAEGIVASISGGGSSLAEVNGRKVVVSCDIDLNVDDVDKALPVIRRVLTAQGAPPGTSIRQYRPEEVVYGLQDEA
jgi:hypothetical protein